MGYYAAIKKGMRTFLYNNPNEKSKVRNSVLRNAITYIKQEKD